MTIRQLIESVNSANETIQLKGCAFCGKAANLRIDFCMGSYRPEIHCKCGVNLFGGCTHTSVFPDENKRIEEIHKDSIALVDKWNERVKGD